MKCVNCDTPLHIRGDDESTQFARNTCQCEKAEKCYFKGKCKKPVVQAELESDGETVVRFRCAEHAIADLLDPSVPEPAPAAPVVVPPPPKDPESLTGMKIEEQTFVASRAQTVANVKSEKYQVECSDCKKQYCHSKRKVTGEGKVFTIVCQFCGALAYKIL